MKNLLIVSESNRVSLKVRNLTIEVLEKKKKQIDTESNYDIPKILNNVSFDLPCGEIMAIMGGSGSGKTTLLNTLLGRINFKNKKLKFTGIVNYSTISNLKHINSSYLLQDDIFLPGLTVFEILKFQAELKQPNASKDEQLEYIEYLLNILEIEHLRDTIVMSFSKKISLSGGEQRRLSIAIILLDQPTILALDEPTTGLDSLSSLTLMRLLRKLASPEIGITIILSIHQPRVEVTQLFDKVCLLTMGGRMIYYGTPSNMITYFKELDFLKIDSETKSSNYIDYIMKLAVKDMSTKTSEIKNEERIKKLVENWDETKSWSNIESSQPLSELPKLFIRPRKNKVPFFIELWIHIKRTFLITSRDRLILLSMNGGSAIVAAIAGWIFYKPIPNLSGIRSLTSVLYVMMEFLAFTPVFVELEKLWQFDGRNYIREYRQHNVTPIIFILSRFITISILETIPIGAIFAAITYFMWGLRSGVGHFFIYFIISILITLIGMSVGMLCFAIGNDFALSTMYLNFIYQLLNSSCGYFVIHPLGWIRWTKYISYFWYGFGASSANQFTNWVGDCPFKTGDERCVQYTGNYQLKLLDLPKGWIAEPIGILIAWLFGFYLLAWIALSFRSYDTQMSKSVENKIGNDEESDIEINIDSEKTISNQEPIAKTKDASSFNIRLDHINLQTNSQTPTWILQDINASFQSSSLNVIIGPSGSGKTSLLKLLSNRLPSGLVSDGNFLSINSIQPLSPKELSNISSFVAQNDSSLIPTLSVRETLYYQAKLRLPPSDQDHIPSIVNSLIRKVGLIDCADRMIGSEFTKGISGGEKRRTSIAIQLLSRHSIMFLDEPTSGLDSQTALSILKMLKNLAQIEGTTIITTIHQPNEDMIDLFDRLLILNHGKVLFDGMKSQLVGYLQFNGFSVETNIINCILDNLASGFNFLPIEYPILEEKKQIDLRSYQVKRVPFPIVLSTLTKRQFITTWRSVDILFTRIIQVILLGVVHVIYFTPLKNNQAGIQNRLGLIQEVLNLYFIGLINNISLYPKERDIFYQEYKDGLYGVNEFILSYLINELPGEIIPTLIFSALIVFPIGLPRNPAMYFGMFFSCFASINIGESLGIIMLSIFDHLGVATNILGILMTIAVFMAGTMSLQMPIFFRAWNWINPLKYAVGICAKLGFQNQIFEYNNSGTEAILNTGKKVLEYYNLNHNLKVYFSALIICLIIYRIIAILILTIRVKTLL
ncbi:uncharacterized protein KGF55_004033 [Candida pseudojiufengensis]|uniref:uncharacterized protein n=1 Tax=Candida pseudojiufengensis TaxID=497109 RepID=UPI002224E045|nr:uncharacterized protein KGF55_004033 [Candida pseudojiufengensis]KAI5961410.1 hypothetical protein KGF55_004033 [Candida pseudojiufengensis]